MFCLGRQGKFQNRFYRSSHKRSYIAPLTNNYVAATYKQKAFDLLTHVCLLEVDIIRSVKYKRRHYVIHMKV